MARKGGYQIFDVSGRTFVPTGDDPPSAQMKKGTFKALKLGSKPVYVSGLNIETVEYSDSIATIINRRKTNPNSDVSISYILPGGFYVNINVKNDDSATAYVNE